MDRPSPAYSRSLAESAVQHTSSKTFSGSFLRPHKPWLMELAARLQIASVLDYGAGKGVQWAWRDPADGKTMAEAGHFEVACYDPAYPPFATEPAGKFDLVICSHTLAWIPVADHDWVLERIFGFATKAVFIAERIGERKKVHVLGEPGAHPSGRWTSLDWIEAIEPARLRHPRIETHLAVRYESASHGRYTGRFVL
jgi:hypothetical protein